MSLFPLRACTPESSLKADLLLLRDLTPAPADIDYIDALSSPLSCREFHESIDLWITFNEPNVMVSNCIRIPDSSDYVAWPK